MMVCIMHLVTCVFYMSLCTLIPIIILMVWVAQRWTWGKKTNVGWYQSDGHVSTRANT